MDEYDAGVLERPRRQKSATADGAKRSEGLRRYNLSVKGTRHKKVDVGGGSQRKLTPLRAIRKKCIDCCCGNKREVRLCPLERCPLWPYRMGHRPDPELIVDSGKFDGRL